MTAGSRVTLPDGNVVKAGELNGADGLLFRRNSQSGAIEALPRSGNGSRRQLGSEEPARRLHEICIAPALDLRPMICATAKNSA